MDENDKYSLDNLEKYSYRVLQKMAKSLSLPSNVKKVYLKELIHTKKFGTDDELDSIIHQVKVDQLKTSQARKKKKIIKKLHLQGTEITSTSGTPSPPLSKIAKLPEIIIRKPEDIPFSPLKPIKTYASPKKTIGSDRILRSFNMTTRRPNYSILNSSVVEVFKTTRMREKERVSQSKINMMAKCLVKRMPAWENEDLAPISRSRSKIIVMACSSLPEKRQRTVSGIYPIMKDNTVAQTNRKYIKSINFRCNNGRVSKINAVIQKTKSTMNIPSVNPQLALPYLDYPNLTASTESAQSLILKEPHTFKYTVHTQSRKRKNQSQTTFSKKLTGNSVASTCHMPTYTWHHYASDSYANSSNYIPDQEFMLNQHFPQQYHLPSPLPNYQDWSVPCENLESDVPSSYSNARKYQSNYMPNMPGQIHADLPKRPIFDLKSHQRIDLQSHHRMDMPNRHIIDLPKYQIDVASRQTNYMPGNQNLDVPSFQKYYVPSYQKKDFASAEGTISKHQRVSVPSHQAMDLRHQPMDLQSHQSFDIPTYLKFDLPSHQRVDVQVHQRVDLQSCQKVDVPIHQKIGIPSHQTMDLQSNQQFDIPTQQKFDIQDHQRNDLQSHQGFDLPTHQRIHSMPNFDRPHNTYSVQSDMVQDTVSKESLPRIDAAFSKFNGINIDATQPLYVQVSQESERLPITMPKNTNVNMLESLYNFRNQFVLNQPLLKIATTNTKCVYTCTKTPVMTYTVPQSVSSENPNVSLPQPVDPFEFTLEPEVPSTTGLGKRMQRYDTEMTASNSSLSTCKSQDLNATIPEMVEDAMELISQDGDYMERLGMDVKVQCFLCEWSGSKLVIECHIRNQHSSVIDKQEKPEWIITYSLHSLIQGAVWLSQVMEHDSTLYILSVKYQEPDCLMAAIYTLYDETVAQESGSITIYNKVTGEPFTWEGDLQIIPININYVQDTNCFKLPLSKLNVLPNTANIEIVNGELLTNSSSKAVVGSLELKDLQVILFVKIFKRDMYY